MYIPRKLTGMFVITCLLTMMMMSFVGMGRLSTDGLVIASLIASIIVASTIINWVGNEKPQESNSRRKVEKLLREFDDDELDLLRSRLMRDDPEVDYGSMAELVQSGKRKNEVR